MSEFSFTKPALDYNITFYRDGNVQIGRLDFNGPAMVFTGNAEESAKVFFDWIAKAFVGRLEQERQAATAHARDVAVGVCEELAGDARRGHEVAQYEYADAIKEALK